MPTAEAGGLSVASFAIAVTLVLAGLCLAVREELRQNTADPASVKSFVGLILLSFWLLLAGGLGTFSLQSISRGLPPLSPSEEEAIAKVSQQYLLRAQVVLLAILGLMVPMIFGLWNSFSRDFLEELRRLASADPGHNNVELQTALLKAKTEYMAIHKFGAFLQPPFYFLVCFVGSLNSVTFFL